MKVTLKQLFERTTLKVTELQFLCKNRVSYSTLLTRVVRGYRVAPTTVKIVLAALNEELGTAYTPDDIEFLPEIGEEGSEDDEEASFSHRSIA